MASHSEEDSDQKGLFWSKGRKKSSRWHSDTLRTNFVKYSSNNNELTKSGKLLGSFLSKRRGSNSLPPSSTSRSPSTSSTAETDAAISRGVEILQSIFPKWEKDPLQSVLEANCLIMEEAISAILKMEEEDSPSKATSNGFSANAMQFPIKNPLPDDFLRLPDFSGEEEGEIDLEEEKDDEVDLSPTKEEKEKDETSEKESTIAEDDGTLYGKTFGSEDGDEHEIPVLNDEQIRANQKIVSDAMNQKFLPVELRQRRSTIFDTAHIEVIKRSKLDLSEAENRIRHREPHRVFDLLSKASEIYRSGVISSQELDTLRNMILSKIQPSKMLIDNNMNMDGIISDHEWHTLILKCKAIRQALSIRIIRDNAAPISKRDHADYMIRVVDVETGVVWLINKRFRDLYKLHRKLSRLSNRLSHCDFPHRRSHGKNVSKQAAIERLPVVENFLREVATLVTPSPLSFLHGCALKHLQQFLEVPADYLLEKNKSQSVMRELRVYVFHVVNDSTSPEGKACKKFLSRIKDKGIHDSTDILEELGHLLDSVQEYMFEHRYEEMRSHVMRLMKNLSKNVEKWRTSSYANLFNADVLTNNDKLQQMISDAIRHELEEKIYAPLMHDLVYFLQKKVHAKEKQFMERVLILKGKPQSYFGIPIEKISLSSWRTVVDAIKEMDGAFLPLDKLRKLVAAAHQIHSLYHKERELLRGEEDHVAEGDDAEKECNTVLEQHDVGGNSNHEDRRSGSSARSRSRSKASSGDYEDVLSGDDFLPIFIYVIVHSELEFPIMTQVLLNRLCDPEKRRSESGYYLATFEAALHHILYVTEDNENSSIIK